jgi:hypothetical protein
MEGATLAICQMVVPRTSWLSRSNIPGTRNFLFVEAPNHNTPNERKVPLGIWECKGKINKSLQLFLAVF